MDAADVLAAFWVDGFTVDLADSENLLVRPSSALTADRRAMLLRHKPEIVAYLHEANATAAALIDAAMSRCDRFEDGEAARAEMERDCLNTPPHLQPDLLDYFNSLKGTL